MQLKCRNIHTSTNTVSRVVEFPAKALDTVVYRDQKVASERDREADFGIQNDTLCRFTRAGDWIWCLVSGRVDGRGVNQQDRDPVLNGIHAATLGAFQAGRVLFQRERLLASRTNQNVE
jgi:hypothetical protein